ncbi:hypothetical protein AVEN_223933-1 [Araneus ventricosus]|uniref:RNase H type-1 domain-containing protein n=1 Tax=Araneus ventricosus TaxID=182803 RepID=A0A4Y2KPU9_ARAVE|nr:hypothetical protein AVEN_223933-1 [Araneus ventricosus]
MEVRFRTKQKCGAISSGNPRGRKATYPNIIEFSPTYPSVLPWCFKAALTDRRRHITHIMRSNLLYMRNKVWLEPPRSNCIIVKPQWMAKLSPHNTVFQAETLEIKEAISRANSKGISTSIWSDSESALRAISSFKSYNPLVPEAQQARFQNPSMQLN